MFSHLLAILVMYIRFHPCPAYKSEQYPRPGCPSVGWTAAWKPSGPHSANLCKRNTTLGILLENTVE